MRHISRDDAVARVIAEGAPASGCLMCDFATRDAQIIHHDEQLFSFVPRFALRPWHVLVIPRLHATEVGALPSDVWLGLCAEAHRLAQLLEARLAARCYVASLGTRDLDVPMSSPHVHLHVVPLRETSAKPSEVLTWKHGVHEHEPDDVRERIAALRPLTPPPRPGP